MMEVNIEELLHQIHTEWGEGGRVVIGGRERGEQREGEGGGECDDWSREEGGRRREEERETHTKGKRRRGKEFRAPSSQVFGRK